jgi:2,3-bisphosphoglycerate-dependent phosphoglycerate mutase
MAGARIWVYRHAESLSNVGERTNEPWEIDLSPHGRKQAEMLASSIEEQPYRLIASGFVRTTHTLTPLAKMFPGTEIDIWPIQEFTYLAPATCVGTSWKERKPRIDAYWRRLQPESVDGPGAESFEDLIKRANAFLRRIALFDDGLTIAVSHGQFMQAAMMLAEEGPLTPHAAMANFLARQQRGSFENCERLRLVASNGRVKVEGRG